MVWRGTENELHEFIQELNKNDKNIKLTYKAGRHNIEFLDILFDVDDLGNVSSNVFRKTTSSNTLLHANSSHPHKLIESIPIGQFLRIRRLCSNDEDFETQSKDLSQRFRERGYSDRAIKKGYMRAKHTPRKELLAPKTQTRDKDTKATTIRNYALYHLYYIECHLFCHLPMRSYIRRPHNPRASTENPRACLGYNSSESRTGFEQTKDHPPALQGTS
ncbi:uncharacterized protein [Engystomops pustulosus]|uniref:uncharacterized protein n=1 Tax=Engystomops pustulosus TaxID=76066 RepID=UPI003AFAC743